MARTSDDLDTLRREMERRDAQMAKQDYEDAHGPYPDDCVMCRDCKHFTGNGGPHCDDCDSYENWEIRD